MNYIGSKLSLLDFLSNSINKTTNNNCKVFCDLFSGTATVSKHFKQMKYKIIANDIQYYSYILNKHYIENNSQPQFNNLNTEIPTLKNSNDKNQTICDYLTNINNKKGFIYNNYCIAGTKNQPQKRMYFSDHNAMKCDAIRQQIEHWKINNKINNNEYFFLLTSLLESIDKYANTASVYSAFLKHLKKSAQKNLIVKPAQIITNNQKHQIFNQDANKLINNVKCDILYLDPPYNNRQYASNYHMLETIAQYDSPQIHGKTGLRNYTQQKSKYCSKLQATETFNELITKANTKYIFLSYNNEGLMNIQDIKNIMQKRGKYTCYTKIYNRFKADKTENRKHKSQQTTEYLHTVTCK